MSSNRDYILFLDDILESIRRIEKYTEDLAYDDFQQDEMTIDAVVRNFEIIGEAVSNIPGELKDDYPDVEWKEAIGFRNVMIHDYFGVDKETVWETIQTNLPPLKQNILRVKREEESA